jgi:hypothetical protein
MENLQKDFIPFELALRMKQLGFDEPCFGIHIIRNSSFLEKWMPNQKECEIYFGGFLAPTYSQAFRFFREKYKKVDYPEFDYDEQKWYCHFDYKGYVLFNTYEEAELACLEKLCEIVEQKQK